MPEEGKSPGALKRAAAGAGRAGVKAVRGFWYGFAQPFRGARFIYLEHPGLVRFWIWPLVITLCVVAAVILSIVLWHDDLLALMWARPEGQGFWVGVQRVLRPIVQVLLFVMLLVAGLFAVYALSSPMAAPFNDMLSEEVERITRDSEPPRFSWRRLVRDLLLTLRLEAGKAAAYVLVMVPAFLLSLLFPVVGQIIYTIFGTLFTMIFFALDYTDWPLARRGLGVGRRVRILRAHSMRMAGLGTGVWLFLLIPFVGLLFMPAAVAGGTLLVLDLEAEGALEVQSPVSGL